MLIGQSLLMYVLVQYFSSTGLQHTRALFAMKNYDLNEVLCIELCLIYKCSFCKIMKYTRVYLPYK